MIPVSGRWVTEDSTLDAAGDGNVVSHLSSDSGESQGRPLSALLVAGWDSQRRRRDIDDSRGGLGTGRYSWDVIPRMSRRYSLC